MDVQSKSGKGTISPYFILLLDERLQTQHSILLTIKKDDINENLTEGYCGYVKRGKESGNCRKPTHESFVFHTNYTSIRFCDKFLFVNNFCCLLDNTLYKVLIHIYRLKWKRSFPLTINVKFYRSSHFLVTFN